VFDLPFFLKKKVTYILCKDERRTTEQVKIAKFSMWRVKKNSQNFLVATNKEKYSKFLCC
jgi:hypothetical protein